MIHRMFGALACGAALLIGPPLFAQTQDADRSAITKSAAEFAAAFNKSDAKAVAALWTEQGESRDASGKLTQGRAAIEKTYSDFFKAQPNAKLEVLVKSIRFPAKDLAVEEGLLRHTRGPKVLPATTSYVAVHVRDGGVWRIALASESGLGQDRIEDLDWLLGEWTTKTKDATVSLAFKRDGQQPVVMASFSRTATGKDPVKGLLRIALDPETKQIRSWGFEDNGAHQQSLWTCDGKSWILDTRGVLADGTPTAERIVLNRVGPDAITWRAIDRVIGDARLADTPPLKLTRASK